MVHPVRIQAAGSLAQARRAALLPWQSRGTGRPLWADIADSRCRRAEVVSLGSRAMSRSAVATKYRHRTEDGRVQSDVCRYKTNHQRQNRVESHSEGGTP